MDWETIKSKYEDITERFQARYPKENTVVTEEEFPNHADPQKITKDRLISKIKRIKAGYRKAIDTCRRSGGGKVVLALYQECQEIWAGSPAVASIDEGIESSAIPGPTDVFCDSRNSASLGSFSISSSCADKSSSDSPSPSDSPSLVTGVSSGDEYNEKDREATTQFKVAPAKNNVKETRRELVKHLQEKRTAKLSKRLSTDTQLLDIVKQEIQLKRKALEKIEEGEKSTRK